MAFVDYKPLLIRLLVQRTLNYLLFSILAPPIYFGYKKLPLQYLKYPAITLNNIALLLTIVVAPEVPE